MSEKEKKEEREGIFFKFCQNTHMNIIQHKKKRYTEIITKLLSEQLTFDICSEIVKNKMCEDFCNVAGYATIVFYLDCSELLKLGIEEKIWIRENDKLVLDLTNGLGHLSHSNKNITYFENCPVLNAWLENNLNLWFSPVKSSPFKINQYLKPGVILLESVVQLKF